MKKTGKKILIIIVVVAVIATVVILNLNRQKVKPVEVQTEKVRRDRIVQTINVSGSLIPITEVKISANVSARIMNIAIEEGDVVKKGDLLVELDKAQYEAAYEKAQSYVQSNKANLRKVTSDMKRINALFNQDLTSTAELESAEAQLQLAESQVVQAEAALKQSLDDLNKTRIEAPMSGIVTSLEKEVGEIALGSVFQEDVILIISDMSEVKVEVEVDETDVVNVSIGDSANIEFDALPDTIFVGTVSEIAHSATTKSAGTQEQVTNFKVQVAVSGNDARFRPGMSATVDIITDTRENALVVPIQALTARSESDTNLTTGAAAPQTSIPTSKLKNKLVEVVFVVGESDSVQQKAFGFKKKTAYPVARMKPVKTGISSDTHFEIVDGLNEGDEIVVGPYKVISKELANGVPIKMTKPKISK
jgi:HlyD family secretion protein